MNKIKVRTSALPSENNPKGEFNDSKNLISIIIKKAQMKHLVLTLFALFAFALTSFGQTVGDYRTRVDGNWGTLATWERLNALPGTWAIPTAGQGYPGQFATPSLVTIQNGHNISLNVSPANNIGALTINNGNTTSDITFLGTNSLTVNNTTTISSNSNADYKRIIVNAGSFFTGSLITNSGGTTQDAYVQISTGTVTVSGNVTMNSASNLGNYILFTDAGTLNVGGNMSGGGITSTAGGGTNPSSGTVDYNGSGAQNVGAYTYYNLTISGGNTKTMQGNVTVSNTLNLSNGVLSLGAAAYNLVIADGASITGTFDNAHMIRCDGTGYLQNSSTTLGGYITTYPVGTGTYYSPFEVTALSATIAAGAYIRVRAVAGIAPTASPTDLNKYWIISTNALNSAPMSANASFTYVEPDEVSPGADQTTYSINRYTGTAWVTPAGASPAGANPLTTTGTTVLYGTWTARETTRTLYSYQSGDWGTATTWTTDPSGTLSIAPAVPGAGDRVVILNGRTITTAIARTIYSLQINEGGILDIGGITGHDFGSVSGQGLLRLSTATFPGGTFSSFISAGGGTVEYYNSANYDFVQNDYNNLIINLTNSTNIATVANNFNVNGFFKLTKGDFRIGNNTTSRNVTIYGDFTIESTGKVSVLNANTYHDLFIYGNLTNNGGSIKLHNLATPSYDAIPTTGYADLHCISDDRDQVITADGPIEPYWIYVDKGTDQTYMVDIQASGDYFKLFGHTYENNNNSINLVNGTLKLGENIIIPQFIHGRTVDYAAVPANSGQFEIPATCHLWIDGADLTTTNITGTIYRADLIFVYGKLTVSGGSFYENTHRGLVMAETGVIEVDGGTLSASIIRPAYMGGTHRGTYIQTGGIVNIRRDIETTRANGANFYASFTLVYTDNVFAMSGGTLNILNSTIPGDSGAEFSLLLGMNSSNVQVTGGDINITVPAGRNARILTTGQLWNLNIVSGSSTYRALLSNYAGYTGTTPAVAIQPLIIKNNFTISNPARFDAANQNLTVGNNFTLATGASYIPGTNTTIFNALGPQTFDASGTITGNLQNVTLSNSSDLSLINNDITLNGNLIIGDGCTLRDNGRIISVLGNITNSGVHFKPVSGAGSIRLTGTAVQTIAGDGTGVFNNLFLNKTGGSTSLSANTTITGELRLANTTARLNIGTYNLSLGSEADVYDNLTGTGKVFSAARMIQTSGFASDGGVSKTFNSTTALIFPYGFYNTANTTYYYMPGSVQFSSAPTTYGTVTSTPVNARHPLAQGASNALTCYWKTTSTGFTGIPAASVRHLYYYDPTPTNYFVPVPANEVLYVPGVYSSASSLWSYINDINLVDQANNIVSYNVANSADGEFTAGEPTAFAAIPIRYSSGVNGDWDNTATWSSVGVGGAGGASVPTANTIVIIGDDTHNHTVIINQANRTAGSLFIASGSTLDLQQYQGHIFASIPDKGVTGSGKLRIGSSYFPQADFGDFIGETGGTVEYYTIAANIIIPLTSSVTALQLGTYKNLILSPSTGFNITLPDRDLTIYGNLTISGTGSGANDGARTRTAGTSRTYTVNGNLDVNSGLLEYRNGVISTIKVLGNTNILTGAIFRVSTLNTVVNNILELHGNLACEGIFDMNNTGRVYTYFKGTNNASISGGGTLDFYNLFVDKGTNYTPVLTLTSQITTGFVNPFLTLLNGTFRVDNTAITVTITSAATNFTIPSSACLSVNAGTVQVVWEANGGTNNGDLLLSGKLEVLGGSMVIGNTNNNTHNDIEYAAAGLPEIDISDGQLFVNGQIRRSITISSGSLIYRQSAGTTTVNGRNLQPTRALFEITNNGSLLSTSGGSLVIVRNGGTTYGDAYIRPDSASVIGGNIQFGDNTSPVSQNFIFSASVPLWDVTVGTSTVDQNVDLSVLPLTIKSLLKIDGNSVFRANGINLDFEGSLTNNNGSASAGIDQGGFLAGSTTQIVTFNGVGAQTITGNGTNLTNFANLVIATTATVTQASNSNIQINGDLTLTSGTLESAANNIYLKGNVDNNAIHSNNSGTTGGIVFSGTSKQYISGSGTGVFGNINLNNSSGVDMVDNTQINGLLTLTNGRLYIDDYLLTLGPSASVAGTFSATRMILLNGALSDRGVTKLFPTGSSALFRFPIGVASKYTPATYTITANSAPGSITVTPVNAKHPATTDALTNELAYYWYVRSTGFSSPTLTHTYTYLQADVSGTESSYVGGQYDFNSYVWTNLGDVVDETTPTTGGTITLTGVNYIKGEYTAGIASNFGTVNTLYSRDAKLNNNWNDPNNWSIISHAGASCGCIPNGNPVIIKVGHTIELNVNSSVAYSVEVNGILDCSTTIYHSLGHVFGTGKIDITSTTGGIFVFPGGEFDTFFDTPGTTLEFKGTTNATLPLKPGNIYKPYQNVIFSGTGIKYMSAENMKIVGDMTIRSGTMLSDALYNKNLFILGNWTDENTTTDGFVPGTGTVSFEGTSATQQMNVGKTEKFYNYAINNTNGVDLATSVANTGIQISKYLYLTAGNIKSYSNKLVKITNSSTGAVVGGSATSFVDGYLSKNIINGQSFYFPIGSGTRYGRLYISGTTGGTGYWVGSYTNSNPSPTYPTATANLNSPITSVSDNEYWVITRPVVGATARIRLRWDATSYPTYTTDAFLRSRLRVVEYEGGAILKWSERGSIVSGDATAGTVSTATPVTQNDYVFSLGVIGVSAAIADLTAKSVCDNGEIASIPVNLTGTSPWTLSYRTVGGTTTNFTQTGITSSPYTIQLTGADIGGSTGSPYTLSLVSVSDASSPGICNVNTVQIAIKSTYTPNITGIFAVGSGETRAYATTANVGSTFAWSWVGTQGGSPATSTSNPTNILFDQGQGTFQLQVVETSTSGCTASDVQAIVVSLVPVPDITPTLANVCQNSIDSYSTPNIAGNEYRWTVTNGTCTTLNYNTWRAGGNSISVTWDLTGSSSITVEERIAAQPTVIGTDVNTYEVYPSPLNKVVSAVSTSFCDGGSTNIVVQGSQSGITYQLRNDIGDVNIGSAVAGTGGDINLPTGSLTPAGIYTFNVLAYNLGCQLEMTLTPTITVNAYPIVNPVAVTNPICFGQNTGLSTTNGVGYTYSWSPAGELSDPLIREPVFTPTVNPVALTETTTFTVEVTNSGCINSGTVDVTVLKQPVTGPEYHIPNIFGL